jgi:hypothetical protein
MRIRFMFNIMKLFIQYYHETSLSRYNNVKKDIDRLGPVSNCSKVVYDVGQYKIELARNYIILHHVREGRESLVEIKCRMQQLPSNKLFRIYRLESGLGACRAALEHDVAARSWRGPDFFSGSQLLPRPIGVLHFAVRGGAGADAARCGSITHDKQVCLDLFGSS